MTDIDIIRYQTYRTLHHNFEGVDSEGAQQVLVSLAKACNTLLAVLDDLERTRATALGSQTEAFELRSELFELQGAVHGEPAAEENEVDG